VANPNPARTPPLPDLTEETPPRVLLVNDDKRVLDLLQLTLQGRGYVVETCHDGDAALDRLLGSTEAPPDLVVVDLRLPRRSGVTICQKLREESRTRDLPVVMISGQVAMETRIQVLRSGADDLITKPFSPRELILRIQKLLARVSRQRELEERLLRMESELEREREGFQKAHRGGRRLRRSIMDGVGQLAEAFLSAGTDDLEQALVHFVAGRWNNGPFVYLAQDHDGILRPLVSRCIPEQLLPGLQVDVSSCKDAWPVPSAGPTFLEEIPEGPPLKELRRALVACGLKVLVPAWVNDGPMAMLALGEQAVEGLESRDELDLARSLVLAFYSFWHRSRLERKKLFGLGDLTASWIDDVEQKDRALKGHSRRVAEMCQQLGKRLGLREHWLDNLRLAGLLHRMSKTSQPGCCTVHHVINADEESWPQLTEKEEDILLILRHQGEAWDGSGFPDGFAGSSIPLGSRIVAVADAYVSAQGSAEASSPEIGDAMKEIQDGAGIRFDPDVARALETIVDEESLSVE
jgi:response regulator RpfG family c-di-GMP phosphodiesterase